MEPNQSPVDISKLGVNSTALETAAGLAQLARDFATAGDALAAAATEQTAAEAALQAATDRVTASRQAHADARAAHRGLRLQIHDIAALDASTAIRSANQGTPSK